MEKIPERFTEIAVQLANYSRQLYSKGFADANGGNLSVRLDNELIMTTPAMESKGYLSQDDMAITDIDGIQLFGLKKCSSEITSHLAVYKANKLANAIINSHPPYVCSYAYTSETPDCKCSPEAIIWTGEICDIPSLMPGSKELAERVEKDCKDKCVILLRNHGLLTWGRDLKEAWWRTEVFEHHCKISHLISARGQIANVLDNDQISVLNKLRDSLINNSK